MWIESWGLRRYLTAQIRLSHRRTTAGHSLIQLVDAAYFPDNVDRS